MSPFYTAAELRGIGPEGRLKVIQGAGHFVHREKSQEVATLVQEFL